MPARVVALISVNGGRSSFTERPALRRSCDVDGVILHRAVERLFEHRADAVNSSMNSIIRLKIGQQRGEVALLLQHRTGGLVHRHTISARDDVRQRRLAQPGGPNSSIVIQRFAPRLRRASMKIDICRESFPGQRIHRCFGRSARSSASSCVPALLVRSAARQRPCLRARADAALARESS